MDYDEQREGLEHSRAKNRLNDKLDTFIIHDDTELLDILQTFNNNFYFYNETINNEYSLSEELILQVCEKILTVFNSYKINTIKHKYSDFKENIDKLINIYNLYNPPSNSNTVLIREVEEKLKKAEEAAEEAKKTKAKRAKYGDLFIKTKITKLGQQLIIVQAKESYNTLSITDISETDYITQFITKFIDYQKKIPQILYPKI